MAVEKKLMSKKKPTFPVNNLLDEYLKKYNRNIKISIFYDDLLRFQGSVIVYDKKIKMRKTLYGLEHITLNTTEKKLMPV